jgi:hypothetical protein
LTFLKIIQSIDLWSTYLKLLESGALRSIIADLPKLLSQSTKCPIISVCSPSINYFDNYLRLAEFFKFLNSICYN